MPTPLESLAALAQTVAARRRPQRVLLEAPEGLGKSHTLRQLAESFADEGRTLLQATGATGGTLGRLLQALVPLPPGGAAEKAVALEAAPGQAGLEPQRRRLAAELLSSLVAAPDPAFTTAGLDPLSRREGACAELVRTVSAHAATAPLLLAIDDLHLADAATLAFADLLAHLEESVPLLVVLTADSSPHDGSPFLAQRARWLEEKRASVVTLPPLLPRELEALLAAEGCEAQVAGRLTERSAGNPGLALGLWALVRQDPQRLSAPLPASFDALRVEGVRARGDAVLAGAQRAALLGPRFLIEALGAAVAEPLLAAGILTPAVSTGAGPATAFADPRLRAALLASAPAELQAETRVEAGDWAGFHLPTTAAALEDAVPLVVPLALPMLRGEDASLWRELYAEWLASHGEGTTSAEQLELAARTASGVRKLVLLRRVAEAQLFAGQPSKTLATLQPIGRGTPLASPLPAAQVAKLLAGLPRRRVERWESLTAEEAVISVDLVRADALSQLVRRDDTVQLFGELGRRLERLKPGTGAELWVRWARSWSWFLCEILGKPQEALDACEKVRRAVPPELLERDADAAGFLRAQEMACSCLGNFERALALAEELIQLARSRGDRREECLGWNARAILHFGQGELTGARRAFERSLELARSTGWLRREAIATHNLSLVLLELGELKAAQASEERYATLSLAVGNHAAIAEAPAVLAAVALARNELPRAEQLLSSMRRAADTNGWTVLQAWGRALMGRLRVQRFLEGHDKLELAKAKNDFLAAIDLFEEHSTAWTEEVDPAEVYALHATALKLSGNDAAAREALERARRKVPAQNVVSQAVLAVAAGLVAGTGIHAPIRWFEERGYDRFIRLWRQLAG